MFFMLYKDINFNYSDFWFPVPGSRILDSGFWISDSRFSGFPDFKFRIPCFRVAAGLAVPS